MPCPELVPQIEAYVDGELAPGDKGFVDEHLRSCHTCQLHLRETSRIRTEIRHAHRADPVLAPDTLKAAVFGAIAAQRRHTRNKRLIQVGVVTLAASWLVMLSFGQYRHFKRRQFVEDAALRHARQYPLEARGDELERFFGGKFDHHISVPRFPTVVLAGGRLLNVRDRQAAYIRYQMPHPTLQSAGEFGLFVFSDKPGDVDVGSWSNSNVDETNGYRVVSWREGEIVYELVTDLDAAQVRELLQSMPSARSIPNEPLVQPASLRQP
jgi:anti-sigma factor RsiW